MESWGPLPSRCLGDADSQGFVNITTDSTQVLRSHSCVVYTHPDTADLSPSKNYLS